MAAPAPPPRRDTVADIEFFLWQGQPRHDAWAMQPLTKYYLPEQILNGPCGVLAVWSLLQLRLAMAAGVVPRGASVTAELEAPEDLQLEALFILLSRAATAGATSTTPELVLCVADPVTGDDTLLAPMQFTPITDHPLLQGAVAPGVLAAVMDNDPNAGVKAVLRTHLEASFQEMGGCLRLVYSLIATRGLARVRADLAERVYEPLITQPFGLCSSELMGLLMKGAASGDFADPKGWGGAKDVLVGVISSAAADAGAAVAPVLISPPTPHWILHGGDHFTALWGDAGGEGASGGWRPTGSGTYYHWNGLAPAGPRLSKVELAVPARPDVAGGGQAAADGAPANAAVFVKPEVGEVDDVIQAEKTAHPKDHRQWTFEVALAVEQPGVTSDHVRDEAIDPVRKYDLGDVPPRAPAWRCRKCYETRFTTFCFGENKESVVGDDGTVRCKFCATPQREAGWTLWLHHNDLPEKWQRKLRLRYGPKILAVLNSKWRDCTLVFEDEANPPAV